MCVCWCVGGWCGRWCGGWWFVGRCLCVYRVVVMCARCALVWCCVHSVCGGGGGGGGVCVCSSYSFSQQIPTYHTPNMKCSFPRGFSLLLPWLVCFSRFSTFTTKRGEGTFGHKAWRLKLIHVFWPLCSAHVGPVPGRSFHIITNEAPACRKLDTNFNTLRTGSFSRARSTTSQA